MSIKTLLLSPVLIPQALWVMARATRLPEAEGKRMGKHGTGARLRLLVLGDSSAAGVGAPHQDQALIGQLVTDLARVWTVEWRLIAQSGATSASTLSSLDDLPPASFDAAVVCLGVNDAKNGVRLSAWRQNYSHLRDRLQGDFGVKHMFFSGLPPMRQFPSLPWPLNAVLGDRAAQFDKVLQSIAAANDGAIYIPLDVALDPSGMAADGFHPGPAIYAEWAAGLSAVIGETVSTPG